MILRILLIYICLVQQVFANEWYAPFCETSCESNSCQRLEGTTEITVVPSQLIAYSEIVRGAEEIQASVQAQVNRWGDFTRWLKGDETKGSVDGFDDRWQRNLAEARGLLEIHEQIRINQRRLDICYRGQCSAYRRVELEDERDQLNRIKLQFSSLAPWWISEHFLELAQSDDTPTDSQLKNAFLKGMGNFFTQSFDLSAQASSIKVQVENAISSGINQTAFIATLSLQHSDVLDLILQKRLLNSIQIPSPLCEIVQTKDRVDTTRSAVTGVFNTGLLLSSLLVGPESLLLAGAVSRVASRGIIARFKNFFTGGPRTLAYGADAVLTGQVINDRLEKGRECQRILALNHLDGNQEEAWQNCLQERELETLGATLASLSTVSTFSLPLVRGLIATRRISSTPAVPAFSSRPFNDRLTLTSLDLTRTQDIQSGPLSSVSGQYWDYVANVYRQRLNLTPDEINDFVASSRAFEDRTKLVVMTRGPPTQHQFDGGVAMVHSNRIEEPLPLEKATGIRLERQHGKIAEIVRLTSAGESETSLMLDLLKEMAKVTRADPEIKKLYVYTSRVHARLYRKLGIKAKQVGEPIDRDVILEIDPADFISVLTQPPSV